MSCQNDNELPLFNHYLAKPTAFSPESVVEAVTKIRNIAATPIPPVCILEFDGDLTDWLVSTGRASLFEPWACFHTKMFTIEIDNLRCGIIPRTIGGPFAVLVAEQMIVSGAKVVIGLTSAGQVSPKMPVPGLVIAAKAIRDEGTSYHYLPPAKTINGQGQLVDVLKMEIKSLHIPVLCGLIWTTDAPYRETEEQLSSYANDGVLAVEMQGASLFALSEAKTFPIGIVAYVTNSRKGLHEQFDKGTYDQEFEILKTICRAANRFLLSTK